MSIDSCGGLYGYRSMILELLNSAKQRSDSYTSWGSLQGYSLSSSNSITMTDINGDGLVDFLYSSSDPIRRAIIVNHGNYTFKTVYKCAIDGAVTNYVYGIGWVNNPITYYGDCADPTR